MDALTLTKATVNALDFEDSRDRRDPSGTHVKQSLRQGMLTLSLREVRV